jgi:hypothetical protein
LPLKFPHSGFSASEEKLPENKGIKYFSLVINLIKYSYEMETLHSKAYYGFYMYRIGWVPVARKGENS